jgi:hypothetical protein
MLRMRTRMSVAGCALATDATAALYLPRMGNEGSCLSDPWLVDMAVFRAADSVEAVMQKQKGALHHDGNPRTRDSRSRIPSHFHPQRHIADIRDRVDQQNAPQLPPLRLLRLGRIRIGQPAHPPAVQAQTHRCDPKVDCAPAGGLQSEGAPPRRPRGCHEAKARDHTGHSPCHRRSRQGLLALPDVHGMIRTRVAGPVGVWPAGSMRRGPTLDAAWEHWYLVAAGLLL